MSPLEESLDSYVETLERQLGGASVPDLAPGINSSELGERVQALVPNPVDELSELWGWRQSASEAGVGIFWGPLLHRLDRIEQEIPGIRLTLDESQGLAEAEGADWPFAADSVVPVMYAGGAYVLVDCGTGQTRGHVFHFDAHDTASPVDMFHSLADAVEAARYCVEAGYWSVDGSGGSVWVEAVGRQTTVTAGDLLSPPFAS